MRNEGVYKLFNRIVTDRPFNFKEGVCGGGTCIYEHLLTDTISCLRIGQNRIPMGINELIETPILTTLVLRAMYTKFGQSWEQNFFIVHIALFCFIAKIRGHNMCSILFTISHDVNITPIAM